MVGWMSAAGDSLDFSEGDRTTDSLGHVYVRVDGQEIRRLA